MSDITRDDLYVADGSLWDAEVHQITDEEFDRLAREAGYCKPSDTFRTEATDDQ